MEDTKGTGCGIWPLLLTNTRFQIACTWHDRAYTQGSYQQAFISRKAVDAYFLFQMQEINKNLPRKWLWDKIAKTFYYTARALGWIYWEGEK